MDTNDKKRFLIEVLDRGILDLHEFDILTGILTGNVTAKDTKCADCNSHCGCFKKCGCDEIGDWGEDVVNPGEYRSKEVVKVIEKIIAEYGQK